MKSSLVRFWLFLVDHLHIHRWWEEDPDYVVAPPMWTAVQGRSNIKTKAEDPYWRRNRKWFLLELLPGVPTWVIFSAEEQKDSFKTFSPVASRYVAKRVSPGSLRVTAINHHYMPIKPLLVSALTASGHVCGVTESEIRDFVERKKSSVTFIG